MVKTQSILLLNYCTEAELERISDPEMFERPSNVASTEGKTAKTKGKIQGKNKVCMTVCNNIIIINF